MIPDFRADLHCHSTYSDGTLTPQQIITLAVEKKLNGLSITDHDTIDAYQEALPAAQEQGIALISGAEFSAVHKQQSIHVLAYSFDLQSPPLKDFCLRHIQRRQNRNQAILNRLRAHQMPLELEDLTYEHSAANHTIGRPHIAMALVKKGYVATLQEAFQRWIGEDKPCYVPGEPFSLEETLTVIHEAKGLAVIAHPHLIQNVGIVRELLDFPFDGIEGYYGRFQPAEHQRWLKIGARKGWLITGGSDFHGDIKPQITLGSSWIGQDTFSLLYQHFQANQTSK